MKSMNEPSQGLPIFEDVRNTLQAIACRSDHSGQAVKFRMEFLIIHGG